MFVLNRFPVSFFLLLLAIAAVPLVISPLDLGVVFGVTALPVAVAVYRAVVHGRPRPRWWVLAVVAVVLVVANVIEARDDPGGGVVVGLAVLQAVLVVGAPLLLGSVWGLAITPIGSVVLNGRILGEERMLASELEGYEDTMRKVKHRLIRLVW